MNTKYHLQFTNDATFAIEHGASALIVGRPFVGRVPHVVGDIMEGEIIVVVSEFIKNAVTADELEAIIQHQVGHVALGHIDTVLTRMAEDPSLTIASFPELTQAADKWAAERVGATALISALKNSIEALLVSSELAEFVKERHGVIYDETMKLGMRAHIQQEVERRTTALLAA